VHSVTHGNFRSRDKDGGHTIRFAIAKKPHAAQKLYGSMIYTLYIKKHSRGF